MSSGLDGVHLLSSWTLVHRVRTQLIALLALQTGAPLQLIGLSVSSGLPVVHRVCTQSIVSLALQIEAPLQLIALSVSTCITEKNGEISARYAQSGSDHICRNTAFSVRRHPRIAYLYQVAFPIREYGEHVKQVLFPVMVRVAPRYSEGIE